jgi:hypothetical protein
MVLSEGTTEKIPSDTTGDRSRDLPTSSAMVTNFRLTFAMFYLIKHFRTAGNTVIYHFAAVYCVR